MPKVRNLASKTLVLTEGAVPEQPHGVQYCNESSGGQWDKASQLIEGLLVEEVIVIGTLRALSMEELVDKAEHAGLNITRLPAGADIAGILR